MYLLFIFFNNWEWVLNKKGEFYKHLGAQNSKFSDELPEQLTLLT